MMINDNERIDDLQRNGYRLIQNKDCFCFGMDAVLLSSFAKAQSCDKVLDMGTGNGVIPILMQAKNPKAVYTGLEIQDVSAQLAIRNVQLNKLDAQIRIVQGDIKEASKIFGGASFNIVTTNPPYMNENHGLKNPDSHKAIARHEILCTLEDVVREGAKVLKPGGRFNMVHRPQRLTEIIGIMEKYKLQPKRVRFVHPFIEKEANLVLIEGVRGGRPMIKVEPPVIVYESAGKYTDEIASLYTG